MTIVLDTNILPRWGTLNAPHFGAILAVAKATGEDIVLPRLVLEESVSARRRAADTAFAALSGAHRRASQYSEVVQTYMPSSDEVAEEWRQVLEETFTVVETPGNAAVEALHREAHRMRPAREGRGGRDVAIWLTALNRFSRDQGRAFFVSENTKDFSDENDPHILHPHLVEESTKYCKDVLVFCTSVDDLIENLATPVDVDLDVNRVFQSADFLEALRIAIDLDMLPKLTVKKVDGSAVPTGELYVTTPVKTDKVEYRQVRAYRVEQTLYALAGFSARLTFTIGLLSRSKKQVRELLLTLSGEVDARCWIEFEESDSSPVKIDVSHIGKATFVGLDPDYSVTYGRGSA
jgi:hypothetical protein